MTPYECAIAENLIAIVWEIFQQRRMRDASMRQAARLAIERTMIGLIKAEYKVERHRHSRAHVSRSGNRSNQKGVDVFDEVPAKAAASDLMERATSSQPDIRAEAYAQIASMGLEPIDLMAKAYRGHHNYGQFHDTKLQNLERRRREVKRDLDDLQKARPVEVRSENP